MEITHVRIYAGIVKSIGKTNDFSDIYRKMHKNRKGVFRGVIYLYH